MTGLFAIVFRHEAWASRAYFPDVKGRQGTKRLLRFGLGPEVGNSYVRSVRSQRERDSPADALRRSGYQRSFFA